MDLQVTWTNGFQTLANVNRSSTSDVVGVLDSLSDLKKTSKVLSDNTVLFFAGLLYCPFKYVLFFKSFF